MKKLNEIQNYFASLENEMTAEQSRLMCGEFSNYQGGGIAGNSIIWMCPTDSGLSCGTQTAPECEIIRPNFACSTNPDIKACMVSNPGIIECGGIDGQNCGCTLG